MDKAVTDEYGIITLPPNTVRFEANGIWYNVTDKIATGRMAAYQKLTATYGFGLNTKGFFDFLNQLWAHLQKMEFGKCSVLVYNAMEGLTKIEQGRVQAFEICTLFINADGENAKEYDEAQAQKKIADWQEAGLDADFFLIQAANVAQGYKSALESLSHTMLEKGEILKN